MAKSFNGTLLESLYDFVDKEPIGRGKYGVVRCVSCRKTGVRRACKTLLKSAHSFVAAEAEFVRKVGSSKYVMQLEAVFETKDTMHLVSPLYRGGELYDFILDHAPLNESHAALLVRQIVYAVQACHEANIVHLDIKPENFVLKDRARNATEAQLVLIDFGHAKHCSMQNLHILERPTGSLLYGAPEVLADKKFCFASDMWSIGVVAYVLLTGQAPWGDSADDAEDSDSRVACRDDIEDAASDVTESVSKTAKSHNGSCGRQIQQTQRCRILARRVENCMEWDMVSEAGKDFVLRLLNVDPRKRLSIAACLAHEWLALS